MDQQTSVKFILYLLSNLKVCELIFSKMEMEMEMENLLSTLIKYFRRGVYFGFHFELFWKTGIYQVIRKESLEMKVKFLICYILSALAYT